MPKTDKNKTKPAKATRAEADGKEPAAPAQTLDESQSLAVAGALDEEE
jgi:hypothetical protein